MLWSDGENKIENKKTSLTWKLVSSATAQDHVRGAVRKKMSTVSTKSLSASQKKHYEMRSISFAANNEAAIKSSPL